MEPDPRDNLSGMVGARPRRPPASRRRKQIVLTIHGVNPNREWQRNVHQVLAPFFDCRAHEYHEYDTWRGPFRAIVSLPFFLCGLLFVALGLHASSAWSLAAAGFACIEASRPRANACAARTA